MFLDAIDVLIVTFNSARTLGKCLESIRRAIPYNRILIGDGGSTDNTISIAEKYGAEIYSFTGDDNKIGRIRYRLAEKASSPWILYVDSDVYLYQNYWAVMQRTIRSDVGMAFALQDIPSKIVEVYLTSRKLGFITFGNTLVPRHLLLTCKELLNMHGGEDTLFARYVKQKRYKIICIDKRLSFHDKTDKDLERTFIKWAEEIGKRRLYSKILLLELYNLRALGYLVIKSWALNDLMLSTRCLWKTLKGFINGLKNKISY